MKNLFLLITVMLTVQTLTSAQDVNEKSWTLIHERFATWCPYCGTWGWDLKDQMLQEFENDNVIYMSVDYSGDLTNPTAKTYDENFGGSGQPLFYVDGVNINASSSNGATKVLETRWEVDYKKDELPFASVGIEAILDESSQSINANGTVKFLQDAEGGDYYFGMYLLEDVLYAQAGRTGISLHKNLLRASFLPEVFNNHLIYGKVDKGTEFKLSGTLYDTKTAKENYHVLGVIWTKNGNKYLYHNAFIVPVKSTTSTIDKNDDTGSFTVYQAESGNIVVTLDKNMNVGSSSEVLLSDMSGKVIKRLTSRDVSSGSIQIKANYTPGVHVVTFNNGKQTTSKKIMLF